MKFQDKPIYLNLDPKLVSNLISINADWRTLATNILQEFVDDLTYNKVNFVFNGLNYEATNYDKYITVWNSIGLLTFCGPLAELESANPLMFKEWENANSL